MRSTIVFIVVGVSTLLACAPDLRTDFPFDGTGAKCVDPATKQQVDCSSIPLVVVTIDGDTRQLIVDATNKEARVYIDLDEGKELKSDEALTTNAWDLAFKRFEIITNGGASNADGQVRVAVLPGGSFEALTKAPAVEAFHQDAADPVFTGVEGGWYYYDLGVHQLITKDLLYVVKSSQGAYFKLRMGSYYDEAGTPARIAFRYAPVEAP